jgi:mono/diheme cytochrome c family protein
MNMFRICIALSCGLALAAAPGCSKESPRPEDKTTAAAPKPAAPPAATTAEAPYVSESEAKKIFVARCASCHGTDGKGDGPGAAALNPKPRNYTDAEWQKTVTDEQVAKTIVYGGAAVGKSPIMPAHPDLDAKPEVVTALVKVIRGFAQ